MVQFSGLFANYTYYQRSTEIFNFCRHLYHSYHYKSLYKGFPNTTAIGFSLSFFLCFTRVFTIEMWHTNKNSICGDYVPLSLLFQDLKRPCNYFFFFIKAQFLTVKKSLEIYLLIFINLTVAVFSFIPRLIGYEDLQAICSYLFRATYIYFPFFFFPVTSMSQESILLSLLPCTSCHQVFVYMNEPKSFFLPYKQSPLSQPFLTWKVLQTLKVPLLDWFQSSLINVYLVGWSPNLDTVLCMCLTSAE